MSGNEKVLELLAKSRFAFTNGEFDTSLKLAREALKLEKDNAEVYVAMGNALMSLERMDEACKSYGWAVNCEPNNPKLILQYGFALMSNEETAKGFENLSKAKDIIAPQNEPVETNEKDDLLSDAKPKGMANKEFNDDSSDLLYITLGMYCFDNGDFKNALNHFSQIKHVSLDILQRKAIICGIESNIREGLNTTNQIKLLNPSAYNGYQLAFGLLVQIANKANETAKNLIAESEKISNTAEKEKLIKRANDHIEIRNELFNRAKNELSKAKKFAKPEMDYYFDSLSFEVGQFDIDQDIVHFMNSLKLIDEGLKTIKVSPIQVIESYVNATEIYLQLAKNAQTANEDKTKYITTAINCLDATAKPIFSFNHGFSVLEVKETEKQENEAHSVDIQNVVAQDDDTLHFSEQDDDALSLSIQDDDGVFSIGEEDLSNVEYSINTTEFLTEIPDFVDTEQETYKIDENAKFECTQELKDQINILYITAYTELGNYHQVKSYAKQLKMSSILANLYMGRYTEVLSAEKLGEDTAAQYEELIKYFKRQSYIDQTDIQASFYLASCYIDTKQFDEAEKLCDLLHKSFKSEIANAIASAKKSM